jgi:hypothetical protein
MPPGRGANLLERFLLAALVRGRDGEILATESGEVRLGEADDGHTLRGGVREEAVDNLEPLLDGRRVPRGSETDA